VTASSPAAPAPLARVRLARDARTQFAFPGLLFLVGAAIVVLGVVAWLTGAVPAAAAVLVGVIGIGTQATGAGLALRIRSLRLAVEPDYLHLTGIRVDRRYHLAPGNLARVASGGVTRGRRPQALGRAVGRATLRTTGESIELIQLGATPSVIVVPTERGRVALAAAAEGELVEALMAAARTRAARPAPAAAAGPTAATASTSATVATAATAATAQGVPAPAAALMPAPGAVAAAPPVAPPRPPEPAAPPRPLTGIERMALEEKLAQDRLAAFSGARTEQAAASLTASSAAMTAPGRPAIAFPPVSPPVAPVPAPAISTPPPSTPLAPAASASMAAPVAADAAPRTLPRALPRALPRRRPLRPMARRVARPSLGPDLAILGVPLVGAAVVWAIAVFAGSRPAADGLDPIGFALLLCGPAAVLAAFLARSRWPRLAGLTSVAAVITLGLVVRALIG
jgi:hypothetical protein